MSTSWFTWKRAGIAAVVVALIASFFIFDVGSLLKQVVTWIDSLGAWGPVLFVLIYIVATVLFVPGSALTLGAGAVFGVGLGSGLVSLGATLGATAAFLIGRYFARDFVGKKVKGNKTFAAIDDAVGSQGWKIVGLTRLSPVFPFTLLNYAFGLTKVSLRDYVLASWIGMMPGTVMYVYLGSIAKAAGDHKRTPGEWTLYGIGLVATIAVTIVVTRSARAALKKHTKGAAGAEKKS